jgi:hypothetical protein
VQVAISATSTASPPSGTVTAFVGTNQLGSPSQVSGFSGNGIVITDFADVSLATLPPGQTTLTAKYSGDSNYLASTSPPFTVTIVRQTTTTLVSSASTIQIGHNVTLTATVSSTQSGPAITGSVQFFSNGAFLSTASISSNGQAQITTSSLEAGTPQIIAYYSGDANYVNSSGSTVVTVNQYQTMTTVSASNPSISQGSSVTFTATVTPTQTGGPAVTGNVLFSEGDAVVANINLSANGQAQFTTNSLPSGTTQITANYAGDPNYGTSSGSLTETVAPTPTFFITDNSPTVTVTSPGQSGSTTLTFTAQNGFTGTQALTASMCSHLPSESTCFFSNPSTVNLTPQTTSQTVTLTIKTTAPSSVTPSARRFIPGVWRGTAQIALACVLCFGLLLYGVRARQHRWNMVLVSMAFVAIATFTSCGGGGSTGPPPPPPDPGTPVGNYIGVTVTVTMGGVTQSITTIAVNVE